MEWVRGQKIGHGSFGTVNIAIPRFQNPLFPPLMAVKSSNSSCSVSLKNEKLILDEFKDYPEVVQCFGDCFTLENGEKLYNVLLEYAPGGSLADKMKKSGGCLPEFEVRSITKSILKGLYAIHRNGYVHCDVKLQNVLLLGDDKVKIADFGLAKRVGEKNYRCELRGTPMYMSPEMVAGGEQEAAADVWALGCLVAEMVTGAPAWRWREGGGFGELMMRIGVGEEVPEIPGLLGREGRDFLGKCFIKDPRERWTAEMLLGHPFVAHFENDLKHVNNIGSDSPRCAFDFCEWISEQSSEITTLTPPEKILEINKWDQFEMESISPTERINRLVMDHRNPVWSSDDGWVTVRS